MARSRLRRPQPEPPPPRRDRLDERMDALRIPAAARPDFRQRVARYRAIWTRLLSEQEDE